MNHYYCSISDKIFDSHLFVWYITTQNPRQLFRVNIAHLWHYIYKTIYMQEVLY